MIDHSAVDKHVPSPALASAAVPKQTLNREEVFEKGRAPIGRVLFAVGSMMDMTALTPMVATLKKSYFHAFHAQDAVALAADMASFSSVVVSGGRRLIRVVRLSSPLPGPGSLLREETYDYHEPDYSTHFYDLASDTSL